MYYGIHINNRSRGYANRKIIVNCDRDLIIIVITVTTQSPKHNQNSV
jgi:hypothetical protein